MLRPAADSDVTTKSLVEYLVPSISHLTAAMPPPPPDVDHRGKPIEWEEEVDVSTPSWLSGKGEFTLSDVNFSRPRPDLRAYALRPKRKETDDDWVLRPFGEPLEYDTDSSWGGRYLVCC